MIRYVLRRLLQIPVVLLAVSAIIFFALRLGPFNATAMLEAGASDPVRVHEIKAEWGLTQPIPIQYLRYIGHAVRGDFGRSFANNAPVSTLIGQRLPATIELAVLGMLIGITLGVSAGLLSAIKPNTWLDNVSRSAGLVGISLPGFWLGVMFISLFSVKLGWLPAGGRVDTTLAFKTHTNFFVVDGLIDGNLTVVKSALEHMVLPALVLGLFIAGFVARITRSAILDALVHDYIRTARAKGASRRRVVLRHALRNALLPLVTISGLQFGLLLGGAAVAETVFAYPGMGKLLVDAIVVQDFPQIQASLLIIAVIYAFANLIVDVVYYYVDPRIRVS
jgi:peptide/nickel transport system permease protein